ncbi:hypothetical protein KR018_010544 [Drosophila ironensis]|nr:hypothetical protein KR018_010544 [Drosophila ironensis]
MRCYLVFGLLQLLGATLPGRPGRTWAEELLELACSSDEQCAQLERGKCLENVCACLARDSAGERVPCTPVEQKLTNIVGGPCPCAQPHAECDKRRDQCICSQGHVPSEDRRRCLPEAVPLAGTCELSRQCQLADRFSICHQPERRCICRPEFERHQGRCLAVLQSSCQEDKDCGTCGASLCLPKIHKCGCSPKYVHNRNMTKCTEGLGFNDTCEHSAPCQLKLGAAGQCLDHQCSCRPHYYPKRVTHHTSEEVALSAGESELEEDHSGEVIICDPIVAYGAYCRNDADCRMQPFQQTDPTAPHPMVCQWGECRCSEDYQLLDNRCIRAWRGSAVQPGPLKGLLLAVLVAMVSP